MFENLYKFFNENDLIDKAYNESTEMLKLGQNMYTEAFKNLREAGFKTSLDFSNVDLDMNSHERSIRRKVFTYLSISQKHDLNASLILVAIVHDMERIGDYAKNIFQLSKKLDGKLSFNDYESKVAAIETNIGKVFAQYVDQFNELASDDVREIMTTLTDTIVSNDQIMDEIIDKGENAPFNKKEIALCIVYLRFLKRISSHLRNIASSFINPFDRIGFSE
jgi:phosphate uptake regulator